jgi:hypothetical protein
MRGSSATWLKCARKNVANNVFPRVFLLSICTQRIFQIRYSDEAKGKETKKKDEKDTDEKKKNDKGKEDEEEEKSFEDLEDLEAQYDSDEDDETLNADCIFSSFSSFYPLLFLFSPFLPSILFLSPFSPF